MKLYAPQTTELKPRIVVFGIGGAGGNAVNNMIEAGLEGVEFVVANTDAQHLSFAKTDRRVQLGETITQGLGAGAHSYLPAPGLAGGHRRANLKSPGEYEARALSGAHTPGFEEHTSREDTLAERLMQIQHEFHDVVVVSTHVHLDHDNCLETVLLRGSTAQVRKFSDAVITERGVRHGQINIVPVEVDDHHGHDHSHDHGHVHSRPET